MGATFKVGIGNHLANSSTKPVAGILTVRLRLDLQPGVCVSSNQKQAWYLFFPCCDDQQWNKHTCILFCRRKTTSRTLEAEER